MTFLPSTVISTSAATRGVDANALLATVLVMRRPAEGLRLRKMPCRIMLGEQRTDKRKGGGEWRVGGGVVELVGGGERAVLVMLADDTRLSANE